MQENYVRRYRSRPMLLKANRDRNRELTKQPLEALERSAVVRDRIKAESTAIRARAGLPPVPENGIERAARERTEMLQAKAAAKASRKRPKARKVSKAVDPLANLAQRRRDHQEAGDALDKDTRALIASKEYGAAEIALALGISRQRVYQLAA